MIPAPPIPDKKIVCILDILGYKNFLYGGDNIQDPMRLECLYEKFVLFEHAIKEGSLFSGISITETRQFVNINEKIGNFIASDTLMLWTNVDKVDFLIAAISRIVLKSLGWGIPLRGAVAYGDCIFDLAKNILIGYPLIDAYLAEQKQNWIGIGILDNAVDILKDIYGVVPYPVPVKSDSKENMNFAVAWHWAEEEPNAAMIYLNRMIGSATQEIKCYYDNAKSFISENPSNPMY